VAGVSSGVAKSVEPNGQNPHHSGEGRRKILEDCDVDCRRWKTMAEYDTII